MVTHIGIWKSSAPVLLGIIFRVRVLHLRPAELRHDQVSFLHVIVLSFLSIIIPTVGIALWVLIIFLRNHFFSTEMQFTLLLSIRLTIIEVACWTSRLKSSPPTACPTFFDSLPSFSLLGGLRSLIRYGPSERMTIFFIYGSKKNYNFSQGQNDRTHLGYPYFHLLQF